MKMTRRYIVAGRVQGVGFRWFTAGLAEAFDLGGWVRNRDDGTVEIVATGTEATHRSFREQLGIGPETARVDRIESEELPLERFDRFRQIR